MYVCVYIYIYILNASYYVCCSIEMPETVYGLQLYSHSIQSLKLIFTILITPVKQILISQ